MCILSLIQHDVCTQGYTVVSMEDRYLVDIRLLAPLAICSGGCFVVPGSTGACSFSWPLKIVMMEIPWKKYL